MPETATDGAGYVARHAADGSTELVLGGRWTLQSIGAAGSDWRARLQEDARRARLRWNCLAIDALDSVGAVLLWNLWGRRWPDHLEMQPRHRHLIERLAAADAEPAPPVATHPWIAVPTAVGLAVLRLGGHLRDFTALLGQLALDALHLARHPGSLPWREISANIYHSGVRAMPVTALVGFLIGVVLSYLSALQLGRVGADTLIVNVLGLGIVRELGPVLAAVLVAGRSGSAMTAQLGVMRVTEEIDALAAMGVSRSLRLILPKVVALAIVMPLLVLWTSAIALLGGMVAADVQLGIDHDFFFDMLPRVVPVVNLWIGLGKGVAFGIAVALVACHFGLRVKPNTESLARNTTAAVVASITLAIMINAIFAVAFRGIGVPKL